MPASKSVKLRNAYVPRAYALQLRVDLDTWTYEAHEQVTLHRCVEVAHSDVVQLHAAPSIELVSIDGATLLGRDAAAQTLQLRLPVRTRRHDGRSRSRQHATHDNADESVVVHFHFRHCIQQELRGFYCVRYTHDGRERRMASTHFEPTAARLLYICQDEPAARADFTLSVALPDTPAYAAYTVLSNAPLRGIERRADTISNNNNSNAMVRVHAFDTIARCPPYLTACVVGELECVEACVGTVPVRVWATPGKARARGAFALQTVVYALTFFERLFGCAFPLPKLDVVAVPDFPIGGMENWGCITCIESILLDDAVASVGARKRASELLCHEVSHNWFGNLVGIRWWEGLWLKEGFATWCGNYATHVRERGWGSMAAAAAQIARAMDVDMHVHSHPVEQPIADPGDITQMFDAISYDKGMGLVLMLRAYLGRTRWRAALAHYIATYAYDATTTLQLWRALETASRQPVAEAMTSFTTQMGHPLVLVQRVSPAMLMLRAMPCQLACAPPSQATWCVPVVISCVSRDDDDDDDDDNGGGDAACEAKQLAAAVNAAMRDNNDHNDHVAVTAADVAAVVTAATDKQATYMTFMLRGAAAQTVTLSSDALAASTWLTANPQRCGFYRCRYDDGLFAQWLQHYATRTARDRRALIADTFASLHAGFDDAARVAALAAVVHAHELDADVLDEYCAQVQGVLRALEPTVARVLGQRLLVSLVLPLAEVQCGLRPATPRALLRQAFFINTALGLLLAYGATPHTESAAATLHSWALREAAAFLHQHAGPPASASSTHGEEAACDTTSSGANGNAHDGDGHHYLPHDNCNSYARATLARCLDVYMRHSTEAPVAIKNARLYDTLRRIDGDDELCRAVVHALCMSSDVAFACHVARRCIAGDGVRSHYGNVVFDALAHNPSVAQHVADTASTTTSSSAAMTLQTSFLWAFFCDNYDAIAQQWGSGQFRIQAIVASVGSTLAGDEAARSWARFFDTHALPSARLAIGRAREDICHRGWLKQHVQSKLLKLLVNK